MIVLHKCIQSLYTLVSIIIIVRKDVREYRGRQDIWLFVLSEVHGWAYILRNDLYQTKHLFRDVNIDDILPLQGPEIESYMWRSSFFGWLYILIQLFACYMLAWGIMIISMKLSFFARKMIYFDLHI